MKSILLAGSVLAILCSGAFGFESASSNKKSSYLYPRQIKRVIRPNSLAAYPIHARGKKGRKYVRRFSLKDNLRGDKLEAYRNYGYTPHRLRFLDMGKETERWRYYSLGLELTFDAEGNLVSERRFGAEPGHID
jgi:hypothetical protein